MKIRVNNNRYDYMGLAPGSYHNVKRVVVNEFGEKEYYFTHLGRKWALTSNDCDELVTLEELWGSEPNEKLMDVINTDLKKSPVKSDGGSSTYYDIDIPAWLLYTLNERQKEGKCYIKTEELIECGFSSDFDAGNIFKSLVRAWGALNGAGKAGNGVDYECNKIVYSANKLKQRNQRKEQK